MLDVHPPHHAVHAWRDFFIHIATIVVGLLIAVGLEQTVEYVHHRHQARDARENIQEELDRDAAVVQSNIDSLLAQEQMLQKNADLLQSSTPDSALLPALKYDMTMTRPRNAAWSEAKLNGSLSLSPPREIALVNYFYETNAADESTLYAYFTDISTASAILERSQSTGHLKTADRQQLLTATISATGLNKFVRQMLEYQADALKNTRLQ